MTEPYVLYAGKLATNKGVQYLLPAVAAAGSDAAGHRRRRWPAARHARGGGTRPRHRRPRAGLVAARGGLGVDAARARCWRSRRTDPESLSRVLIEAAALGVPIAAMDTGGTRRHRPSSGHGPAVAGRRRPSRATWRRSPPTSACAPRWAWRRARTSTRGSRRRRWSNGSSRSIAVCSIPERHDAARPLRVAVVARAVMPLHGVGGLERSVRDLLGIWPIAASHVTLIVPPASRPAPGIADPFASPRITHSARAVPDVSAGQPARHDDARPQHGVLAVRLAGGPPRPRSWPNGGEVDIVHGFGASVARGGWRTRSTRRSCSTRRASRSSARRRRARVPASAPATRRCGGRSGASARAADRIIATDVSLEPTVVRHLAPRARADGHDSKRD